MNKNIQKETTTLLKVSNVETRKTLRVNFYQIVKFDEIIIDPEDEKKDKKTGISGDRLYWREREVAVLNLRTNRMAKVKWGSMWYQRIEIGEYRNGKIINFATTPYEKDGEILTSFNCVLIENELEEKTKYAAKQLRFYKAYPIEENGNIYKLDRVYKEINEKDLQDDDDESYDGY